MRRFESARRLQQAPPEPTSRCFSLPMSLLLQIESSFPLSAFVFALQPMNEAAHSVKL